MDPRYFTAAVTVAGLLLYTVGLLSELPATDAASDDPPAVSPLPLVRHASEPRAVAGYGAPELQLLVYRIPETELPPAVAPQLTCTPQLRDARAHTTSRSDSRPGSADSVIELSTLKQKEASR